MTEIPLVAPALERKSVLVVSGNLLDERGLVANQQRHRFLKVIIGGGRSTCGHVS